MDIMDISFSVDENSKAICTSTPKRNRERFTCHFCDKVYVSRFHFDKHVKSHSTSAEADATDASLFLDVSSVSFDALKNGDDKSKAEKTDRSDKDTFKVPKPASKVQKRKAKLVCTYCLKGYVCSRSFHNHMRAHAVKDAAARFPDKHAITQHVPQISINALTEVANAPSSGESGAQFKEFIGFLVSISQGEEWSKFSFHICQELIRNSITAKKFLLPSSLRTSLVDESQRLTSDKKYYSELLGMLSIPDRYMYSHQCSFLLEFVLLFAKEILKFISKTVCVNKTAPSKVPELDAEDRQVVYYIGGSIMRGYLRIAYRCKKSIMWTNIAQALRTKVLTGQPQDIEDASWTAGVNRGGLLFISSECQKFFLSLTEIVFSCEKRDGSIDHNDVIFRVSNSQTSVLWDNIIYDSLTEDVSLNLMNDVIRCFCNTCGRGFAKKRLNILRERPVISMPMRHRVAGASHKKKSKY